MKTKEIIAGGEKTKVVKNDLHHRKIKKTIIVLLLLAGVLFAGLIFVAKFSHQKFVRFGAVSSNVSVGGGVTSSNLKSEIYPIPADYNQFIIPEDAAENGELSIGVDNLDEARKKVSVIAQGNGGSVYSTNITYSSNSIKKGVIVLQVPAQQFAKTFEALKAISSQVFKETTQKINSRNIAYPVPMSQESSDAVKSSDDASEQAVPAEVSSVDPKSDSTVSSSIYPGYYPQPVQDKGYIKVSFANYNKPNLSDIGNKKELEISQSLINRFWFVMAIKMTFLILLFALLILLIIRIFKVSRKPKTKKTVEEAKSVITRQSPKSRKRVVKIKSK
ncbi:MAG: DUF4349 domain-containing protein [Candidatus Moranbacteria bacterium]|nr:DUF4349 domain-containing protein [Candidatus Moranbacteria bacterium]